MENVTYQIDEAMLGSNFAPPTPQLAKQYLRAVAQYLTNYGYEAEAVTDSYNGAAHNEDEIPEVIWERALKYADQQFDESFWRV